MFSFKEYLIERNLAGAPGTEGKGRGISHIIHYLGPHMSSKDKAKTIQGFKGRISKSDLPEKDGEFYHPQNDSHELGSNFGDFKKGEKIKIKHAFLDDNNRMMVQTENHGIVPASKIKVPENLARKKKTQGGLDLEDELAGNFGSTTSSKGASNKPDYEWEYKNVKIKGESKANSGARMGVANLSMDKKTGSWSFNKKSDPKIVSSMMNARVTGQDGVQRNIVDHYNHHYRGQATTPSGRTTAVGTGVASAYLGRYNALHLNRKTSSGKEYGTSFTLNNFPHAGKTNIRHLEQEHIDGLEGVLDFEKTNGGSVRITHTPNAKKYDELARSSISNPENNGSFRNKEDVEKFKTAVMSAEGTPSSDNPNQQSKNKIAPFSNFQNRKQGASKNPNNWTQNQPAGISASNSWGGRQVHADHEIQQ
jgi:hypothetical protein